MHIVNDTVTRYWAATVVLLAGVLTGYGYCLPAVTALRPKTGPDTFSKKCIRPHHQSSAG